MIHSFKNHSISEADKLWLEEVYNAKEFNPRVAKVKLRDKLPINFNPMEIDQRILTDGKNLTIVGVWHVDPESIVLKNIDIVIRAIKKLIIKKPGIEVITNKKIAEITGLTELRAGITLNNLNSVGWFFSSAKSSSDTKGYSNIVLSGDNDYDEYLNFTGVDDLLEKYYQRPQGTSVLYSASEAASYLTTSRRYGNYGPKPETQEHKIKHNTAFILMAMDPSKPELEDVSLTIKDVCRKFGINAFKANEIEHQDRITDLILSEIKLCEFLIADLSHERPNVYYEIGYAHALNKRPILYRKSGTKLHFDLSVHNVPEYKNITELRNKLTKRLEAILGKSVE